MWLIIGIILLLAEGVNPGTFAIFFGGVGALVTAAVCYVFPIVAESGSTQLLIFAAMSFSSLMLLRPWILRLTPNKAKLDGCSAYMGKQAKTLTHLRKDGLKTGRVFFDGTEWPAVPSEEYDEIPAGSTVEIVKREGLTFHVRPKDDSL